METSHHEHPPVAASQPVNPPNLSGNLPQLPHLNDLAAPGAFNSTLMGNISAAITPLNNFNNDSTTSDVEENLIHQPPDNNWHLASPEEFPSDCSCRVYNMTTHVCERTTESPALQMNFATVEPYKTYYEVDDQTACSRICDHWMAQHWRLDLPICSMIPVEHTVPYMASIFAKAHMSAKWYFVFTTPDVICCKNSTQVDCHAD